jgi:serine/threonine protein kinase
VRLSRSETHSANEILKPVILKRAKLIAPQYSDMNEPLPESFDVTFDTYHAITLDAIISEVVALRQIGSDAPNIIKFHGLTTAPPWGVCLVMERLDGSLEQCLMDTRWQGSTPLRARLSILCDVARALDCVHRKGWCHRAVCPNNVLLSLTDSKGTHRPVAKLCNFAFARKIDHYENGAPHFQPLDVDASHDSNRNDSNKMGRRQSMGSLMRRVTRMALEKANRQKVSDAVQKSTGAGGNDVKLNENLFDGGLGELYLEDVGPCGYLAPELLTNSAKAMGGIGTDGPTIPARGSDIFNFGLLAWEVTARSTPLVAENNPIGMGAPSDDMFGESGRPRARTFTGGSKLTTDDGAVDDDESEVSVKSIDFDQLHKCKLDNPLRGKDPGFIASFLLQGGRPSFGSEQPELLRHMVRACWETRCVSRPSMAVVYHMLEELLSSDLALAQLYDRNLVGRSQLNLLRRGAHPLPTSPARAGSSSSMLSIANTKLTLLPGFKEEVTNATSPMAGAPSGKALQREVSHLQATITTTFQQDQPLPMSKLERDLTSCDIWQVKIDCPPPLSEKKNVYFSLSLLSIVLFPLFCLNEVYVSVARLHEI